MTMFSYIQIGFFAIAKTGISFHFGGRQVIHLIATGLRYAITMVWVV